MDKREEIAILPCPFCGERKLLMVVHDEKTILHPHYHVQCDNCGARSGGSDKGDHVDQWNTRALIDHPEEKAGGVERLRGEWQPIETAPKDGTKILICQASDADGKPITGDDFGLFVQRAAWWGEEEGWIVYCSLIQEPTLFFEPTHWMPIPEPPSNQHHPDPRIVKVCPDADFRKNGCITEINGICPIEGGCNGTGTLPVEAGEIEKIMMALQGLMKAAHELRVACHHDCGASEGTHLLEHLAPASLAVADALKEADKAIGEYRGKP